MNVKISREALNSIMTYALTLHPKEAILLLRGRVEGNLVVVEEVLIPPLATYGGGFSIMPLVYLPIDHSVVGTVHSHPSGSLNPSVEDLNNMYGRIMMIAAYPYRGLDDIAAYGKDGSRLQVSLRA